MGLLATAAGCGSGSTAADPSPQPSSVQQVDVAAVARAQAAADRKAAAAKRAAKRRAARDRVRRAEALDQQRGDALAQAFTTSGTRDQWSIIGVTVHGGDASVHTDLAPGNAAAFSGACTQLIDAEPWVERIDVIGTDGVSHASWSTGERACQTPVG